MIAFITVKSSLVTLMEGLSSSNQCRFGFSVIRSYLIFFFFRSKNISKEKKQLVVNKMNQLLDLRLWLCCAMAASEASVLQVLVVPWPWWNRPGCRRYICHVICRVAHHWIVDCIFARCVRQGAWWVRRGSVAKWRGGRRARVGWLGRTAGHVTQKGVCSEYISSIFTIAWHMLWYWWKIRHVLYPLRLPMSVLLLTALRLILLPCIGEAKLVSSWRSVWRAKVAFGEVGLELFAMSSLTDENEVSEDALVRVPLGFDFLGLGRVCAQGGAASSRGSKRLVSKKRDTMSESKSQVRSPLSFLSCRNTYQNTCICQNIIATTVGRLVHTEVPTCTWKCKNMKAPFPSCHAPPYWSKPYLQYMLRRARTACYPHRAQEKDQPDHLATVMLAAALHSRQLVAWALEYHKRQMLCSPARHCPLRPKNSRCLQRTCWWRRYSA